MSDTLQKNPTLKLADNIPVNIRFDSVTPKPFHSEQYGTDSYMYFVFVDEVKHVWFATQRQHDTLQDREVNVNNEYTILKKKLPGDKFPEFLVQEAGSALKASADKIREQSQNELESFLLDTPPEHVDMSSIDLNTKAEQVISSRTGNAINANKRSLVSKKDPIVLGMCFKLAVQHVDTNDVAAVKSETGRLYQMYEDMLTE